MSSDADLFSSVQQHLHANRAPATESPYETQLTQYGGDSDSVYHLQHAGDGVYETGVMHPKGPGAFDSASGISEAPYLTAAGPDGGSMSSARHGTHYSPPHYGGAWGSDSELPLAKHGSTMNFAEDEDDEARQLHHPMGYDEHHPTLMSNWMPNSTDEGLPRKPGKFAWSNPELLQRQIDHRQRGGGRQSLPLVSWFLALGMTGAFIAELIIAKQTTGQAIQTHPQIQPMLGPSAEFLISFGARFVPCMRSMPGLPATNRLPCLEYTTSSQTTFTPNQLCPLAEICGLADASNPNQSYRFVSAIVHILFNLLVLLTLCCQIEKLIGSVAYTVVFVAGGIGGNLLGGNFGLIGQPALGASGSIYTCISLEIVDLIYNSKYENRARTRIVTSTIFSIIGLGLGLLPGIDNFSHIGGFCIGILGGLFFAPSIHATRSHMIGTWVLRLIGLGLLVAYFVALGLNFYRSEDPRQACTWCRYLSCLPVFQSCKGIGISTTDSDGQTATN